MVMVEFLRQYLVDSSVDSVPASLFFVGLLVGGVSGDATAFVCATLVVVKRASTHEQVSMASLWPKFNVIHTVQNLTQSDKNMCAGKQNILVLRSTLYTAEV